MGIADRDIDWFLLLDSSSSLTETAFNTTSQALAGFTQDWFAQVASHYPDSGSTRFGMIQFATDVQLEFNLAEFQNADGGGAANETMAIQNWRRDFAEALHHRIYSARWMGGSSSTAVAVNKAKELLLTPNYWTGSRVPRVYAYDETTEASADPSDSSAGTARKAILILTDGLPYDQTQAEVAVAEAVASGIVVFVVGFGPSMDDAQIRTKIMALLFPVSGFHNFGDNGAVHDDHSGGVFFTSDVTRSSLEAVLLRVQHEMCVSMHPLDPSPALDAVPTFAPTYAASCSDGKRGQFETDIDCGGEDCMPCKADGRCELPSDCESKECELTICAQVSLPPSVYPTSFPTAGPTFTPTVNPTPRYEIAATKQVVVFDDYYHNCLVFADCNDDGEHDPSAEPSCRTIDGRCTLTSGILTPSELQGCVTVFDPARSYSLSGSECRDAGSGAKATMILRGPASAVSPVTTLRTMLSKEGATAESADAYIKLAFPGLEGCNLDSDDPFELYASAITADEAAVQARHIAINAQLQSTLTFLQQLLLKAKENKGGRLLRRQLAAQDSNAVFRALANAILSSDPASSSAATDSSSSSSSSSSSGSSSSSSGSSSSSSSSNSTRVMQTVSIAPLNLGDMDVLNDLIVNSYNNFEALTSRLENMEDVAIRMGVEQDHLSGVAKGMTRINQQITSLIEGTGSTAANLADVTGERLGTLRGLSLLNHMAQVVLTSELSKLLSNITSLAEFSAATETSSQKLQAQVQELPLVTERVTRVPTPMPTPMPTVADALEEKKTWSDRADEWIKRVDRNTWLIVAGVVVALFLLLIMRRRKRRKLANQDGAKGSTSMNRQAGGAAGAEPVGKLKRNSKVKARRTENSTTPGPRSSYPNRASLNAPPTPQLYGPGPPPVSAQRSSTQQNRNSACLPLPVFNGLKLTGQQKAEAARWQQQWELQQREWQQQQQQQQQEEELRLEELARRQAAGLGIRTADSVAFDVAEHRGGALDTPALSSASMRRDGHGVAGTTHSARGAVSSSNLGNELKGLGLRLANSGASPTREVGEKPSTGSWWSVLLRGPRRPDAQETVQPPLPMDALAATFQQSDAQALEASIRRPVSLAQLPGTLDIHASQTPLAYSSAPTPSSLEARFEMASLHAAEDREAQARADLHGAMDDDARQDALQMAKATIEREDAKLRQAEEQALALEHEMRQKTLARLQMEQSVEERQARANQAAHDLQLAKARAAVEQAKAEVTERTLAAAERVAQERARARIEAEEATRRRVAMSQVRGVHVGMDGRTSPQSRARHFAVARLDSLSGADTDPTKPPIPSHVGTTITLGPESPVHSSPGVQGQIIHIMTEIQDLEMAEINSEIGHLKQEEERAQRGQGPGGRFYPV
jgi:hypothetical protein